jgi:hypothetical protein
MSTPRKARALVPRGQVTEHIINLVPPGFQVAVTRSTINLSCPAKVTRSTINLSACYVPVVTPEKQKPFARVTPKKRGTP